MGIIMGIHYAQMNTILLHYTSSRLASLVITETLTFDEAANELLPMLYNVPRLERDCITVDTLDCQHQFPLTENDSVLMLPDVCDRLIQVFMDALDDSPLTAHLNTLQQRELDNDVLLQGTVDRLIVNSRPSGYETAWSKEIQSDHLLEDQGYYQPLLPQPTTNLTCNVLPDEPVDYCDGCVDEDTSGNAISCWECKNGAMFRPEGGASTPTLPDDTLPSCTFCGSKDMGSKFMCVRCTKSWCEGPEGILNDDRLPESRKNFMLDVMLPDSDATATDGGYLYEEPEHGCAPLGLSDPIGDVEQLDSQDFDALEDNKDIPF